MSGLTKDIKYAAIARRHGIRRPFRALREARKVKVGPATAMALLQKESGGWNVWGHDRNSAGQVIWPGGAHGETVYVTKENYLKYKERRKQGHGMQGCGPLQLTWFAFQDAADKIGGCWKAVNNLHVGYSILAGYIASSSYYQAFKRYNGSDEYARDAMRLRKLWRERFGID